MSSEIIISIIAFLGTIISGLISGIVSNSITKYRIEQLEKKVEKHNSVIERTYKLEQKVDDLERSKNA